MDPNLTYPIILNPTLNATLYQPPQEWYYAWVKDWSPIILGVAQVIAASVLAKFTYNLSGSTSEYANQVRRQTDIMNKNTALQEQLVNLDRDNIKLLRKKLSQDIGVLRYHRLRDEMDKIVAPLHFAALSVNEKTGNSGLFTLIPPLDARTSEFWDGIKKNMYLSRDEDLKTKLTKFFDSYNEYIISGMSHKESESSIADRTQLITRIEERYPILMTQLKEIETDLGINIVSFSGAATGISGAKAILLK